MVCKDKRKVWVNVKGHKRRVLKCQNKSPTNKLKLPGARIIPHKKTPLRKLRVALKRLTFRKPYKKIDDDVLLEITWPGYW